MAFLGALDLFVDVVAQFGEAGQGAVDAPIRSSRSPRAVRVHGRRRLVHEEDPRPQPPGKRRPGLRQECPGAETADLPRRATRLRPGRRRPRTSRAPDRANRIVRTERLPRKPDEIHHENRGIVSPECQEHRNRRGTVDRPVRHPGLGSCAAAASEDMPRACPVEMSVSHSSTPCTARTDAGPTEPVQRPSLVVPVRWSTAIVRGVLTMTGSGLSNQIGAGDRRAFPVIGPADGVAVRQLVAAAVLFPVARPALHRFTWRRWRPPAGCGHRPHEHPPLRVHQTDRAGTRRHHGVPRAAGRRPAGVEDLAGPVVRAECGIGRLHPSDAGTCQRLHRRCLRPGRQVRGNRHPAHCSWPATIPPTSPEPTSSSTAAGPAQPPTSATNAPTTCPTC